MATRLDDIQPLDLASIRDDAPERPPWTSRATGAVALAVVAVVFVVVAALVGDRVPLGPGPRARDRAGGRVGARRGVRRRAPTARAARRDHGPRRVRRRGRAVRRGARRTRRRHRDRARLRLRACAARRLRCSPRSALHLVLGVPDGSLVTRARRLWVVAGYAASVVLAVVLVNDRPDVARRADRGRSRASTRSSGSSATSPGTAPAASVQERARLQWPAWGVVVAARSRWATWVLHELLSWPDDLRTVVLATTVLIPLSLALGASERMAVRIDRLLVHTITMAGLAAMVAASYLLIVLGLGRSPTGDEKTLLGLSMLAAAIAALLWIPVRERLTEFATASRLRRASRARRGHPHVRQPPDARAPARRAAAAAGGVVEEDDVAQRRRGVDRAARAAGSSARCRCPTAGMATITLGRGGGDRRRASRRVGRGVGEHLAPAGHHRRPTRCCGSRRSRTAASCSA